jgi:allantoin racemase
VRLVVLTPVSLATESVGESVLDAAKGLLRPDTTLEFKSLSSGRTCIESDTDALLNGPETLALALVAEKGGADGVFINCFDDPAAAACRENMKIPVFGAYIPTVLTALGMAERIGVITTDAQGVLSEERKARAMGISSRLAAIRYVDMSVLGILADREKLVKSLCSVCIEMHEKDLVGAVCLGCTGMAHASRELREELRKRDCQISVVEPVATALTWLEREVVLACARP